MNGADMKRWNIALWGNGCLINVFFTFSTDDDFDVCSCEKLR